MFGVVFGFWYLVFMLVMGLVDDCLFDFPWIVSLGLFYYLLIVLLYLFFYFVILSVDNLCLFYWLIACFVWLDILD